VIAFVGHGLTHAFIVVNIGHDANHRAVSERSWLNRVLALSMDLCGINSPIWRRLHHRAHHYCINIEGEDEALAGRGLLRFSALAPWRPWQRVQHLYAALAYALYSLDYVLAKDVRTLLYRQYAGLETWRPGAADWLHLVAGKLFYFSYMIVVPFGLFGHPPVLVLAAFVAAHAIIGTIVVLVFQTTHVVLKNVFPTQVDRAAGFEKHVFATTQDVATHNALLSVMVGGLNHHVVHHLFPSVCHTHFPRLTPIVRDLAIKYGFAYREAPSFAAAVRQHLQHLYALGLKPPAEIAKAKRQ
jgi:linoleoyl-CoA desaturase